MPRTDTTRPLTGATLRCATHGRKMPAQPGPPRRRRAERRDRKCLPRSRRRACRDRWYQERRKECRGPLPIPIVFLTPRKEHLRRDNRGARFQFSLLLPPVEISIHLCLPAVAASLLLFIFLLSKFFTPL